MHADDASRVTAAADAHKQGRSPTFEVAYRMVHKDGSIRWFLARGAVVEREAGRPVRMIGTTTDITAQKDAEQALEEAKAELARLTRLSDMGGLTAAIAHEVNQPLCAIVANASAALRWLGSDRPDVPQVREALTDVVCDGKRASELIRRTRGLFERGELAAPARRLEQRDRQRAGADAGRARCGPRRRADRARCVAAARAGRPRADAAGVLQPDRQRRRGDARGTGAKWSLQIRTVFEAGSGIHAT